MVDNAAGGKAIPCPAVSTIATFVPAAWLTSTCTVVKAGHLAVFGAGVDCLLAYVAASMPCCLRAGMYRSSMACRKAVAVSRMPGQYES